MLQNILYTDLGKLSTLLAQPKEHIEDWIVLIDILKEHSDYEVIVIDTIPEHEDR